MKTVRISIIVTILLSTCIAASSQSRLYKDYVSNQFVTSFLEDDQGYIWMGTMRGLCRYDGTAYLTFTASSGSGDIDNDYIYDVCKDAYGNVWVATKSGLLSYHDGRFAIDETSNTITNPVTRVLPLGKDHIIASGQNGIVKFRNPGDGSLITEDLFSDGKNSWNKHIDVSPQGDIWYAISDGKTLTVSIIDSDFNLLDKFDFDKENLAVEVVRAGINNSVWVCASFGVLMAFDETSRTQVPIPDEVQKLIGDKWIYFIERYGDNSVLLGIKDLGIYVYNFREKSIRCVYDGLLDSPYYRCMVDSHQNIWLSDNKSTPICINGSKCYTHHTPFEGNSEYIRQMDIDRDGHLHLNTEIVYYTYSTSSGSSRQDLYCRTFYTNQLLDSGGDLWLLHGPRDIGRYSLKDGQLRLEEEYNFSNNVVGLGEDTEGNVWVFLNGRTFNIITPGGERRSLDVTGSGFSIYSIIADRNARRIYISTDGGDIFECNLNGLTKQDFPTNSISAILHAQDGTVWLGTHNKGLVHFNPGSGETEYFAEYGDEYGGSIKALEEDSDGNIWFSTSRLISKLRISDGQIASFRDIYFSENGFYEPGCSCKDNQGRLYFGGNGGYTLIDTSIPLNGDEGTLPLLMEEVAVNGTHLSVIPESLKLAHNERNLSFRFARLNFSEGEQIHYAYMLDGADKDWILTNGNTASYNNLSPGHYTFRVRARGNNSPWQEQEIRYGIHIKHSLWGSLLFKLLYLSLLAIIIAVIFTTAVKLKVQKERLALAAQREEMQQEQLDFITNISHDFRTPLSLVYAPLKILQKKDYLCDADKQDLEVMDKNVSKLMYLSEKLLSASLERTTDRYLNVSLHSPKELVSSLGESFRYAASQKEITFAIDSGNAGPDIYFDREKIENILYNILSNAFKYTPAKGNVSLKYVSDGSTSQFIVSDDGPGIPQDKAAHIFDRFERLDAQASDIQGHGIGLHYAQKLASVHKGMISYQANAPRGSIFTLSFPCTREAYNEHELSEAGTLKKAVVTPSAADEQDTRSKPNIILVEDNEDIRIYLRSLLSESYNITTCADGEEGLDRIRNLTPELVISDVMMPRKDGFTLCRDIKAAPELCHIPVILLTAKTDVESSIKGLEGGAEAYIPKPFDPDHLIASIHTILENRKMIQQKILNLSSSQLSSKEAELVLTPVDRQFLSKLQEILRDNIAETAFSVEALADKLNCSYSTLYSRIKALTGQSPQTYLNVFRMTRARELLESGGYAVAEVADMVGASSSSNFARAYRKQFGKTPTEAIFTSRTTQTQQSLSETSGNCQSGIKKRRF